MGARGPKPGTPSARKGTRNRRSDILLREIREIYPDYDPVCELIRIAKDPETPRNEQINCHKEAAKYLRPQLRAIEVSGDPDAPVAVINAKAMTPEEWEKEYGEDPSE